ncbi:MAG: hypothetical protein ACI840_001365 [Ulvibacter sp.]
MGRKIIQSSNVFIDGLGLEPLAFKKEGGKSIQLKKPSIEALRINVSCFFL